MKKRLKNKIQNLEKRVAALELRVQTQTTVEQMVENLKKTLQVI